MGKPYGGFHSSQEMFDLENCTFIRDTNAAVLIEFDGEEYWIPFSQIERIDRDGEHVKKLRMTAWIAKQKGLL